MHRKKLFIILPMVFMLLFVGCGKEEVKEVSPLEQSYVTPIASEVMDVDLEKDMDKISEDTNIIEEDNSNKLEIEEFVEDEKELSDIDKIFGEYSALSKFATTIGNETEGFFGVNDELEKTSESSIPIIKGFTNVENFNAKDSDYWKMYGVSYSSEAYGFNDMKDLYTEMANENFNYDEIISQGFYDINTISDVSIDGYFAKFYYKVAGHEYFYLNAFIPHANGITSFVVMGEDNEDEIINAFLTGIKSFTMVPSSDEPSEEGANPYEHSLTLDYDNIAYQDEEGGYYILDDYAIFMTWDELQDKDIRDGDDVHFVIDKNDLSKTIEIEGRTYTRAALEFIDKMDGLSTEEDSYMY